MFRWMQGLVLPKKPIILDIGANIGLFSLAYAQIFEGAKIHCFEPVPFIYNYLNQNLKINQNLNKNMHAYNFGMSNRIECKQLSIPSAQQHERYSERLDIRLYSALGQGEERVDANFITVDQWVEDFKISNVDFMKIDVEGYEYLVLEGAIKTLLSFKPVVMLELNQLTLTLSGRLADEYLSFASDHGYRAFGLEYGFKSQLLKINSIEQIGLVSDLILFPNS